MKVIPTWRLVLEPGFEVRPDRELKPKHTSQSCEQEKKLASINGELDTLRMLGKHDNIVRT